MSGEGEEEAEVSFSRGEWVELKAVAEGGRPAPIITWKAADGDTDLETEKFKCEIKKRISCFPVPQFASNIALVFLFQDHPTVRPMLRQTGTHLRGSVHYTFLG